jgi:hypothetical protein
MAWTEAMDDALEQVVACCLLLSTLVCTQSLTTTQLASDAGFMGIVGLVRLEAAANSSVVHGLSRLRRLWVQQLPADSLRAFAVYCPLLFEVIHHNTVSEAYIAALVETGMKSVGFPGSADLIHRLYELNDLTGLRLWDIGIASEGPLEEVCGRSPNLLALALHFTARPNLRIIPVMLSYVRRLRTLSLHAKEGSRRCDRGLPTWPSLWRSDFARR